MSPCILKLDKLKKGILSQSKDDVAKQDQKVLEKGKIYSYIQIFMPVLHVITANKQSLERVRTHTDQSAHQSIYFPDWHTEMVPKVLEDLLKS